MRDFEIDELGVLRSLTFPMNLGVRYKRSEYDEA